MDDVIELYLPTGAITDVFSAKCNKDKLRIIELGTIMYDNGIYTQQCWGDKEWQSKMNILEESYKSQIFSLETNNISVLKESQTSIHKQYTSRIDTLQQTIESLEQRNTGLLSQFQTLHDSIENKFNDRLKERLAENTTSHNSRCEDLQKRLDIYRDDYEVLLGRNNNSTNKGQDGENALDMQLNLMFPKAEFDDTSKQPGRGDFIMRDDNFVMMIENKNYSKNVQKSEIDKFYTDLKREQNNDIQCAVMISMKTGICNRPDFAFEVIAGKPILFIHKWNENPFVLKIAVNIFKNILSQNTIDIAKADIITSLNNISKLVKRNFSSQKNMIDKHHSESLENLSQCEGFFDELYCIINK